MTDTSTKIPLGHAGRMNKDLEKGAVEIMPFTTPQVQPRARNVKHRAKERNAEDGLGTVNDVELCQL